MLEALISIFIGGVLPPDFRIYVHEFEEATGRHEYVDIFFGDTSYLEEFGSKAAGQCFPRTNMHQPYIVVNKPDWDVYSENVRRVLIFHELGHCVLGLPHTNYGIMRPMLPPEAEAVERFRQGY